MGTTRALHLAVKKRMGIRHACQTLPYVTSYICIELLFYHEKGLPGFFTTLREKFCRSVIPRRPKQSLLSKGVILAESLCVIRK